MDELENRILSFFFLFGTPQESVFVTNARHSECLERALKLVQNTHKGLDENLPLEFIVQDLKEALQAVGEVVGEVYTEDLLGVIFSKFCIGK